MSFENTFFFFFKREFQLMASALDGSFLLSDQDTNQFLVSWSDTILKITIKHLIWTFRLICLFRKFLKVLHPQHFCNTNTSKPK